LALNFSKTWKMPAVVYTCFKWLKVLFVIILKIKIITNYIFLDKLQNGIFLP
jgi:hypothetical protein